MVKKIHLLFLIAAGTLHGQVFPVFDPAYIVAPRTIIAGSRTLIGITPLVGFNFTVNPATDVFTVTTAGVTLTNGDIIEAFQDTGGALPAGVSTTLSADATTTDTTLHLTSTTGILSGDHLQIGIEEITCTTVSGNDCVSSVRSVNGPVQSHTSGDPVIDVLTGLYGWPTVWLGSGGSNANYAVCSVSGSTFILRDTESYSPPDSCAGRQVNVTDTGSGTLTAALVHPSGVNLYLDADSTGWPAGTTHVYKSPSSTSECNHTAPTSGGKSYSPGGETSSQLCDFASVSSGATTGTGTIAYTFCTTTTSSNCNTFSWAINVIAPQTVTTSHPSSFPSLTGKANWETVMTSRPCPGSQCGFAGGAANTLSGPANFCDPLASPSPVNSLGAGTGSGVSYYGWNLLFDNMAQYTGNALYRTGCFATGMSHSGTTDLMGVKEYVSNTYPGFGCSPAGNCIGFAHFTKSLFRACRTLSDPTFCTAGSYMRNNYEVASGAKPGLSLYREAIYGLMDAVDLHKFNSYDTPYWDDLRDLVATLILRATESDASGQRIDQQAFMHGLATYAIIQDWQVSGDPRAQYLTQRIWDYEWSLYDQVNHLMLNFNSPDRGPICNDVKTRFQPNGVDGGCELHNANFQSLQAMLVNGPCWLFAQANDTTRRDQADDWFNHVFDQGGLTGKASSEVYFSSFDAVGWCTGTLASTVLYGDAVAPDYSHRSGTRKQSGTRTKQ